MRTPLLSILIGVSLLSACSPTTTSISEQNRNPLTASRYGDELADALASLVIHDDPILKEPGIQDLLSLKITEAKNLAAEAREKQSKGMMGALIPMHGNPVGYLLYLDDILYFSSDFVTEPGVSLRVYLSTVVDPRDASFPDDTAIDLGPLQAVYGAQQYAVPSQEKPELLRTFVLYDTRLKKIYGFAQLARLAQ